MRRFGAPAWILLAVAIAFTSGCATIPYRPGVNIENAKTLPLRPGEPQIVRGRPNRFLDACDWIWPGSLLSKFLLWNKKLDAHQISPETEEAVRRYLEANGLKNVKVRLNSSGVRDEWRRLVRNKAVGAGWRYTLGVLSLVRYTILPGRFFGGDHYNPYTNTLHIYSDFPAVGLHEGGHAKFFAARKLKGLHAALYEIPGAPLFYEAKATNDALGYLRAEADLEQQRAGYHTLYPAYGTYVGGTIGPALTIPYYYPLYLGAILTGHIAGRAKAATLKEPRPVEEAAPSPAPSTPDLSVQEPVAEFEPACLHGLPVPADPSMPP